MRGIHALRTRSSCGLQRWVCRGSKNSVMIEKGAGRLLCMYCIYPHLNSSSQAQVLTLRCTPIPVQPSWHPLRRDPFSSAFSVANYIRQSNNRTTVHNHTYNSTPAIQMPPRRARPTNAKAGSTSLNSLPEGKEQTAFATFDASGECRFNPGAERNVNTDWGSDALEESRTKHTARENDSYPDGKWARRCQVDSLRGTSLLIRWESTHETAPPIKSWYLCNALNVSKMPDNQFDGAPGPPFWPTSTSGEDRDSVMTGT